MQPSEQTDPMGVPRRVPTAKDFPKTGPFSLAAPGPRFGARALDLSVVRYVDGGRPTATQCGLRALLPWSVLALPLGPFAVGAVALVYGTGIGGELHRGWPDRVGGTLVISTR